MDRVWKTGPTLVDYEAGLRAADQTSPGLDSNSGNIVLLTNDEVKTQPSARSVQDSIQLPNRRGSSTRFSPNGKSITAISGFAMRLVHTPAINGILNSPHSSIAEALRFNGPRVTALLARLGIFNSCVTVRTYRPVNVNAAQ